MEGKAPTECPQLVAMCGGLKKEAGEKVVPTTFQRRALPQLS